MRVGSSTRRCQREEVVNYLIRVLLVLLVSLPLGGCGEEPIAEGPTTEESTTEEEPATVTDAADESLDYIALGDSLATGYGATNGYVYRYADLLDKDIRPSIEVRNLGVNGLTSGQLRAGIENDQGMRDAIEQAEVITLSIGANDLLLARQEYLTGACDGVDNQDCLRQAVALFRENWDAILAGITDMSSPGTTVIRTTDFYNPFVAVDERSSSWPNSPANDLVVFKEYLEQVNSHIARSSEAYGIPHAKVYEAFNGPNGDEDPSSKGYISSDRIHPNDEGHSVIAQELRKLGYEPLRV